MRKHAILFSLFFLTACAGAGQTALAGQEAPTATVLAQPVALTERPSPATLTNTPPLPSPSPTVRPSPVPPTDTPIPTPAPLTKAARASCPVSLPNVRESPSEHFVSTISGYQNADGTLFTVFWSGNKVIFSPNGSGQQSADGSLGMKWPWYRTVPGEVVIKGQRLDAPAPPMPTIILRGPPDGYGETGFHPSGLVFPTEGCWEVTAHVGEASLTFVTLVVRVPFDPPRPHWLPDDLFHTDTDVTGLPQSIRYIYGYLDGGEGELVIETVQRVRETRLLYPDATPPVTVQGQPANCVQSTWDEQAGITITTLEWTAENFSYHISQTGLELSCEDLLHIARSLR